MAKVCEPLLSGVLVEQLNVAKFQGHLGCERHLQFPLWFLFISYKNKYINHRSKYVNGCLNVFLFKSFVIS